MPDHIRALIVVLALGLPVLLYAQGALLPSGRIAAAGDRALAVPLHPVWLTVTLLGFLVPSLGLFLAICALLLPVMTRRETVPAAMFLALIMALPDTQVDLPTLGLVEHILPIGFVSLVAVVLMVPPMVTHAPPKGWPAHARTVVLLWLLWSILVQFGSATFTGILRTALAGVLAIYVPFEGARRSLRTLEHLRRAMAFFVLGACILSVIAIFEYLKGWLLYGPVPAHWGASEGFQYLARGGATRATASLGGPIAVGFVCAMALVMAQASSLYLGKPARRLVILAVLAGGLFATVSRGPWVAAVGGTFVFVLLGQHGRARALRLALAAVSALGVLALLPGGEKIIDLLPWIGNADTGSTSYRKDLFDSVTPLLLDNPVFGIPDYDVRPELQHLRQGQQIIDLVNAYLQIGVSSGLVGLGLFVGAHGVILLRLRKALRRVGSEHEELLRALLAAYVTAMLAIATVSTISIIVPVLWTFCGIGAATLAIVQSKLAVAPAVAGSKTAHRRASERSAGLPLGAPQSPSD